jgi:hypothetical protein
LICNPSSNSETLDRRSEKEETPTETSVSPYLRVLAASLLVLLFDSEDGGSTVQRNVNKLIQNYTAIHPRTTVLFIPNTYLIARLRNFKHDARIQNYLPLRRTEPTLLSYPVYARTINPPEQIGNKQIIPSFRPGLLEKWKL